MTWLPQLPPGAEITPEVLLLFGLPVLLAAILLLAVALGGGDRKNLARRIERVKSGRISTPLPSQVVNVRRTTADSKIAFVDTFIKTVLPRRDELRKRLARAGMEISLARYILIGLTIGLVAFGGALWSGVMPPAAAFVGLFAMIGLPHVFTNFRTKRRQTRFIANFPEAIDLMVRGLKSGLPIAESIKNAGEEVAEPVGGELRRVTDSVRLGSKLEDALWETSERLDLPEFNFFTVSLAIQAETGGNLAETLDNLSQVLRGRRQLKLKIKALSSEAKASAYIIGSLPFIMAALIYLVNAAYIMPLVTDPRGNIMIAVGFLSFLVGGFVMYRMVKFEI